MRGVSAIDRRDPAASALAFAPSATASTAAAAAAGHTRFASDMRAALQVCLGLADVLAVVGAGMASFLIRVGNGRLPAQYWGHVLIGCVTFVLGMHLAGMYRFAALRRHREHLLRLTGLWAAVVLLLIAIIYLTRRAEDYSRAWMLLWAFGGWSALVANRVVAWQTMRHFRREFATWVAVVGDSGAAERCAQRLRTEGNGDVEIVGVFAARDLPGRRDGRDDAAFARLRAADTRLDEIVFALPRGESLDLEAALGRLNSRAVDIKIGLDIAAPGGCDALVLVPVWRRPLAGLPTVVKRAIDIGVSAVLLTFVLPLMVIIAALVKLDSPGPALFRQQRFGMNKKPFRLYKFRSMRSTAGLDPTVPQARRHDPRVTRVGRFLRRTSLDELPQLLNVLKGEMSLVGPRPHPTPLDEKYAPLIDGYLTRHHVKPGITGWAQVHGWRGETDTLEKMERRVEYDLYYINHWSLRLDLSILFKTLVVVFGHRNAY